jgi:hypothetical protein
MPAPIIGGAAGFLRRDLPAVTIWCSCGVGFERPNEAAAVDAQAKHAAEMRNPDEHEAEVF